MIPTTGSCRKIPEIAGTWKQYSDRKLSGFVPVNSCQLPLLSSRNRPEIIGKIRKFSVRNTACTKSPELLGTGSFRAGLFDLGIYNVGQSAKIYHSNIKVHFKCLYIKLLNNSSFYFSIIVFGCTVLNRYS